MPMKFPSEPLPPHEPEYERDEADDGDEEFEFDCFLDPSTGLCGAAGSEDCEFECPYNAERDRIRAAVVKRHGGR